MMIHGSYGLHQIMGRHKMPKKFGFKVTILFAMISCEKCRVYIIVNQFTRGHEVGIWQGSHQ